MIVAIDGPAGSGKSTVARAISDRCGLTFLDTGAMYRTVTLLCLEREVDVNDAEAVTAIARDVKIEFGVGEGGQTVFANGREVTADIRTAQVDRNVSAVSAIPEVREAMVALQRQLGSVGDVVAEGRDIGTVVFPDADVKVFLTADAEARARRRAVQRQGDDAASNPDAKADEAEVAQILADLKRRDELDSTREAAPLKAAEDAHHIDSSNMTLEQVIQSVIALMDAARERPGKAGTKATDDAAADGGDDSEDPHTEADEKPVAKVDDKKPVAKKEKDGEKSPAKKSKGNVSDPMRPFGHHSLDDYYDHAVRDFPITSRLFYGLAIYVLGIITKVFCRWKVEHPENLAPDKSGVGRVIIMNHCSLIDPIILYIHLWCRGIHPRGIFKSEWNSNGFLQWVLARVGAIPVVRGASDMKPLRRAQRALQRGEYVVIFPEGTRIRSDDQPVTIHGGFALMARMAGAKVTPCAIVGARDIKPKGAKLPRPVKVIVDCGKEIGFDELGVKGRKEQLAVMESTAMDRVYEIRDDLRKRYPGKH